MFSSSSLVTSRYCPLFEALDDILLDFRRFRIDFEIANPMAGLFVDLIETNLLHSEVAGTIRHSGMSRVVKALHWLTISFYLQLRHHYNDVPFQSQSGQVSPIARITPSIAAMHASGVTPENGFRHASSRAPFQASGSAGLSDGRGARTLRPRLARSMSRAPSLAACDMRGGRLGVVACVADWKAS